MGIHSFRSAFIAAPFVMNQVHSRNWGLGLLLMAATMAVLAFIPVGLEPWSHLAMGRVADIFGTIPDRNVYVYALEPGTKVGTLEWLGQWWMYKIYGVLGLHGLMALRATLAGLALGLAVVVGRVPLIPALLATFGMAVGAAMTPAMFGGFALVLASLIIVAVAQAKIRSGWLFLLILPAAVLVHVDGVFVVIAALALWAAKTRGMRWAWVGAALVVVATLVNPRNVEVWWLAARQFHVVGLTDVASVLLVGLAVVYAFRQTTSLEQRFLVGLVGLFAFFRIELAAYAILVIGVFSGAQEKSRVPIWLAGLSVVFAVMLQPLWAWWPNVAGALGIGRDSGPYARVMAQSVPHEPVQIVKSWGGRAVVLNTTETAGLWMFELGEQPYPMIFAGPKHLRELRNREMVELTLKDVQVLRGVLHQYDVRAALLPKSGVEEAIGFIQAEPRWRMAWEDEKWVLFTR